MEKLAGALESGKRQMFHNRQAGSHATTYSYDLDDRRGQFQMIQGVREVNSTRIHFSTEVLQVPVLATCAVSRTLRSQMQSAKLEGVRNPCSLSTDQEKGTTA